MCFNWIIRYADRGIVQREGADKAFWVRPGHPPIVLLTPPLPGFGIDTARALLPSWITWVSVLWIPALTFTLCASLSYLSARLAMLRESGINSTAWTERARAAYPVRLATTLTVWFCFGFLLVFVCYHENPLVQVSIACVAALCFVSAVLASTVVHHTIAPRIGDPLRSWRKRFRDLSIWLANPSWLIFGLVLFAMPSQLGTRAIVLTLAGFTGFGLVLKFGTLPLLNRLGVVETASERLACAVKQASEKMGVSPSAVFEIDSPRANAFALTFSNQVVFTKRAVEVLDGKQLAAVACHELAHLAEPAKVKFARLAVTLVIFSLIWINLLYPRFGMDGTYGLIAVVLAISLGLRRWQRRLEDRADAAALRSQTDTGVYADALEKIYRASNSPAALGYGRTHSSLYDRMLEAGITPEFARPDVPSRWRSVAALAVSAALLFLFATGFDQWSDHAAARSRPTETGIMWRLAIGAGGPRELAQLGDIRERRGLTKQAATFYGAATELSPYSVLYQAKLAAALSALGRCQEADKVWSEAKDNLNRWYYDDTVVSVAKTANVAVVNCSPRPAS